MAQRILKDYENISLKEKNLEGRLDLDDVFGRKGPVHIEVGSGRGTFLVSEAKAHPQNNYLGIEWASKYYRYAVDRFGRNGLDNVRIIHTDAVFLIEEYFADNCVDWFHIYFPDPWPKARHHKRRFIGDANMPEVLRCLKVGGRINVATDHAGYFEQIEEVLGKQIADGTVRQVQFTRAAGAEDGEMVGTNFERKYIVEGRKVYTIAVEKV
jgi:tRNA (guanine-N7-)-methyltransferase